ncbi:hypothetical protein FB451DRAFT_1340516 [Mycena latifolia]|nr:hypothetical protein FB451DRAFT_1340516 [Mycena latifolia]
MFLHEMISAETLTHINFAFALISNSFTIIEMLPGNAALWTRTTALKNIGGWSFNDPPTSTIFSRLVGSDANMATFIASALNTLQAYGFDGIDVDWEYPAAYDQGGAPEDKANYVTFMSKVKAAFKPHGYGLTFIAPSSFWYLQHFDLPGLMQYADWVNIMTYGLPGTWDGTDPYIGPLVLAHTNLTEITMMLLLFNNVGIDPSQILSDPGCSSPGCAFVGGADPGPCSANSGTLICIETIISQNGLQPIFDEAAAVKYITWNGNQWVSYDDAQTLQMKVNYANSHCLGGGFWSPFIYISTCKQCGWVGDLPNCLNSACPTGKVGIFSDIQGDASQSCIGDGHCLYCCNPPANQQFLPVPEQWVLPSLDPTPGGHEVIQPATFTVDFDDNIGSSDTSQSSAGSSGESDDGKENDSLFGEVFISSPNPGSVSSLDLASDWVIQGCDRSSDQPQEVLAYCSKSMDSDDSGCGHVFIGQATHTIIRLPTTCGLGPYARVVSLAPHEDQSVLPTHIRRQLPDNELVYSLKSDYNFAAIPDDNGPILTVSTKHSNSKRDFHQPEGLERHWFGPFNRWLQKLNTVTNGNSVSCNFHWSDTYTIFHQEESCPNFSNSLDISVTGTAQANSRFGYYLEATIIPPAIQQCYVYLNAGASAQATFTITGLAEAHFGTECAEIIPFGFPGVRRHFYRSLLTLGPSLHLYGELTGKLSMSGTYSASVGYEFPSINLSFGKQDKNTDEENTGNPVDPNANNNGFDYLFGYNVNLEGSVPSLQLGLSIFTEADICAGVGITGSVSNTVAPNFCVNPYFGVDLNAGLTGSVLFWRDNAISTTFYSNQFPFAGTCFTSEAEASTSGNSRRDNLISGNTTTGSPLSISHRSPQPAYAVRVNHICQAVDPGTPHENVTFSEDPFHTLDIAKLASCKADKIAVTIPDYEKTPIISYYDLEDPVSLSPTMGSWSPTVPVNLGLNANGEPYMSLPSGGANKIIYARSYPFYCPLLYLARREHPYEASMSSLFVDYLQLQKDLWLDSTGGNVWCPWVKIHLENKPAQNYYPASFGGKSLFDMTSTCYPSNAEGTPMAILEQDANVIKRTAFYSMEAALVKKQGNPIRADGKFRSYCPQKQIAVLRSAVGVPSFLNEYEISSIFIDMNNCVRNVWSQWATAYQNSAVDAPNRANVNVANLYDNWIYQVVANVSPFIRDQVQHLITLYNRGQTTAATVDLLFPILLDQNCAGDPVRTDASVYRQGVQVTQADLTAQIYNQIQDIIWINFLPRHV